MQTGEDIKLLNQKIEYASVFSDRLRAELSKIIIGQYHMIDSLLVGLLCNAHVLLEGVPGLAKTLMIKSLAQALSGKFSRIQFTPDLLPADVIGTMIYNQGRNEFIVRKGPIFANFILADEINRAPAKVQSALLEAMQEKQVTIGESTYYMDEKIEQYIVDIVFATRFPEQYNLGKLKGLISYGASPRGSINLSLAAKAHAFMQKRGFVIPDDVNAVCKDVMRHRIGLTYEAEAENITTEKIIDDILRAVLVP